MGKKKEKVVDLKPNADKITQEELTKVQSVVNAMNRSQLELGILETRKHAMLHNVATMQEQLSTLQVELEKEYGTFDINIQDGTINRNEDGKVNS